MISASCAKQQHSRCNYSTVVWLQIIIVRFGKYYNIILFLFLATVQYALLEGDYSIIRAGWNKYCSPFWFSYGPIVLFMILWCILYFLFLISDLFFYLVYVFVYTNLNICQWIRKMRHQIKKEILRSTLNKERHAIQNDEVNKNKKKSFCFCFKTALWSVTVYQNSCLKVGI